MLDYAIKLSRTPSAVTSDDVERLRGAGFEDAAILDICQVTSYYNYVNRLADGLGVELESSWRDEDLSISREQFQQARKGKERS
jgi:alkylhydroperoxidase family enzyme